MIPKYETVVTTSLSWPVSDLRTALRKIKRRENLQASIAKPSGFMTGVIFNTRCINLPISSFGGTMSSTEIIGKH